MGLLCPGEFIRTGISEGAGGIARGGLHRAGTAVQGREGQSSAAPAFKTACEGAHARDAAPLEKQRHPGAAGFVRSGAIEDDFAVARDLLVPLFKLLRRKVKRPGEPDLFGVEFEFMPEIDDDDILAG